MATKNVALTPEEKKMVTEVMKNARRQTYTPEKLCQLQKILDTQYFYWWMNDLKKEEYALDIFEENFDAYCTGFGAYKSSATAWARNAKYGNSFMNTAHMGHQPLVWFMDDSTARGVFFFESNMTYLDNPSDQLEQYFIYCNDFKKHADGSWHISAYRLLQTKQYGEMHSDTVMAPDGYKFPDWEEIK